MKKFLAAALLLAVCASPAFANKKPKQAHPKYNYTYHTPKTKYKTPKNHNHHTHAQKANKNQSA